MTTGSPWLKLLGLAVAGALGTLARYGLAGWVQRLGGASFPWGTLAVNALGCLLFGVLWSVGEGRALLSPQLRPFVLVGFMGAFTTFSTYAFETGQFARDSQWLLAVANVGLHNGVGLAMLLLGFALGRLL